MNRTAKRIMGTVLALTLIGGSGYSICTILKPQDIQKASVSTVKWEGKTPKYIFMFIGDGMSYPQIQAAQYYNGVQKNGPINEIG